MCQDVRDALLYVRDSRANSTHEMFPATLPTIVLTDSQKRAKYGIASGDVPPGLQRQLDTFMGWNTSGVNMDRDARHRAVREVTHDSEVRQY